MLALGSLTVKLGTIPFTTIYSSALMLSTSSINLKYSIYFGFMLLQYFLHSKSESY